MLSAWLQHGGVMRKFWLSASLAGLLLTGVSIKTPVSLAQGGPKTQPAAKTAVGTISSIDDGGTSFTLAVNGSSANRTLQFVFDRNTRLEGRVKVGAAVTVEYEAKETGPNLALLVSAQG